MEVNVSQRKLVSLALVKEVYDPLANVYVEMLSKRLGAPIVLVYDD